LPFTPGQVNQCADRCCRIGQKNSVQVFKLISKNTIEEYIVELLHDKEVVLNAVLAGKDFVSQERNMSIQDLAIQSIKNK
jgi:SNF2 family DNA or RNA helicase